MPAPGNLETASILAAARVDGSRLVDAVHAIVLLLDRHGRIVYFNAHLEELTGYRLDELRGQDWLTAFVPTADRAEILDAFAHTLASASPCGNVNPILTRDGRRRQIEWHTETLRDERDAVVGIISVGHDITERLSAEARVRALERQAQQRERLADIGAITAKVVHDIGNPLAAVSMQAQLILRRARRGDLQPAAAVEKPVEKILLTLSRLESLVREFTEFAREQRLQLDEVALPSFLHGIVEVWSDYAASQGVEIRALADAGTPVVKADEAMLRRVLDNLVKNAMDAQETGGAIVLRATQLGEQQVCIAVEDQGSGVPAGIDVFRLFETTKANGTGIGLAVARQLVLAHDGGIHHAPNTPRGTVFFVHLPIAGPEYAELELAPS